MLTLGTLTSFTELHHCCWFCHKWQVHMLHNNKMVRMNSYNSQNTNVHVQTWCTMHTVLEYFLYMETNWSCKSYLIVRAQCHYHNENKDKYDCCCNNRCYKNSIWKSNTNWTRTHHMNIYILSTCIELCFLPLSSRSVGMADIVGLYTVLLFGLLILLLGLQLSMLTMYESTCSKWHQT